MGINWPPYSPDLTVCDYFLGPYLKERVYKTNPRTLEELEESIHSVLDTIDADMIRRSVNSIIRQCEPIIEANGERIL